MKKFKAVMCYDLKTNRRVKNTARVNAYNDAYDAANERKQEYMSQQRERLRLRLTELMQERQLTVSQLRRDSGICFNTLKQIVDGKPINVMVGTVWALSQYFNVPMEEFL